MPVEKLELPMQGTRLPDHQRERSRVADEIGRVASRAADEMQVPAAGWMLRPAAEFAINAEQFLNSTDGNVRLCLSFLVLIIKDIMQSLSGDVPYDALGEELDMARANVQRALRATFRALASDLTSHSSDLANTLDNCSALASDYFSAIERLNRKERF